MSADASRLLTALRSSPFWHTSPDLCECTSTVPGLDLIWYFREFRSVLGKRFSIEATVAHYLANRGVTASGPNLAFDEFWYRQRYPESEDAVRTGRSQSGWDYYLSEGMAQGHNPAFWFDENWYRKHNPDVAAVLRERELLCGFEHYLLKGVHGDALPSMYFNSAWYRKQYLSGESDARIPIIDYLRKRTEHRPTPVPFFDPHWYVDQYLGHDAGHSIGAAYEHYIFIGRQRGYSPSPHFNEAEYRSRYPQVTRDILEGKFASAVEHFATEGVENGFVANKHLSTAAIDYRSPTVVRNYEQSLQLNMKQIAELRSLVMASQNILAEVLSDE